MYPGSLWRKQGAANGSTREREAGKAVGRIVAVMLEHALPAVLSEASFGQVAVILGALAR